MRRDKNLASSLLLILSRLISCLSSDNVINRVDPKLDLIVPKLDKLIVMVAGLDVSQVNAVNEKLPEDFRNTDILSHTEELRRSAHALIRTASSVPGTYSTTSEGSGNIPSFFSENGEPLDDNRKLGIEQWIPQLELNTNEMASAQTQDGPERGGNSDGLHTEKVRDYVETETSDSDGEFDHDVVQGFFCKAQKHYSENKHAEAVDLFRAGVSHAKRLSLERKRGLEIRDIQLRIGFCDLHQGELEEAERLFSDFISQDVSGERVANLLHASVGLAQISLCRHSYQDAEEWCRKSIVGWKRLVGKNHTRYFTSLQLMAFIYETKGDFATADVYTSLVPSTSVESTRNHDLSVWPAELDFDAQQIRASVKRYYIKTAESLLMALGCDPATQEFSPDLALFKLSDLRHSQIIGLRPLVDSDVISALYYVLDRGANVNARDSQGNPVLIKASLGGILGTVQLLCDQGADANAKNSKGDTALHAAARWGRASIVKLLCTQGATIDASGKSELEKAWNPSLLGKGATAIVEAAYEGHKDVVELLINQGADMERRDKNGYTALLAAASKGHLAVVELLIEVGAKLEAEDHDGFTALAIAVQSHWSAMTKLLLNNRASIETKSNIGMIPLATAASMNDEKLVGSLLDAGADIEARDGSGLTALHRATRNNCKAVMRTLLSRGASTETKSPDGLTPLLEAASWSNVPALELLLDAEANIEAENREGNTALNIVADRGFRPGIDLLLDRGASRETRNKSRRTPLLSAALRLNQEAVDRLLRAGTNVDACDGSGSTALIGVAKVVAGRDSVNLGDRVNTMRVLLERGANPRAKDAKGKSALYWAKKDNTVEKKAVVQLLKNRGAK